MYEKITASEMGHVVREVLDLLHFNTMTKFDKLLFVTRIQS